MPSEDATDGSECGGRSLKCRLFGHDWYYRTDKKRCDRCGEVQENEREKKHDDPNAEIGDTRFKIEQEGDDYVVESQNYRRTASGPDSEYYQWFPSGRTRTDRSGLEDLREKIDRSLHTARSRSDGEEHIDDGGSDR